MAVQIVQVGGEDRFLCQWTGQPITHRFGEPLRTGASKGCFADWGCVVAFLKTELKQKKITEGKYLEVLRRITRVSGYPPEMLPIPVAPSPDLLSKMSMKDYQLLYMTQEMIENKTGSQTVEEWKAANAIRVAKQKATQKRRAQGALESQPEMKRSRTWLVETDSDGVRRLDSGKGFFVEELGTIIREEIGPNARVAASKEGLVFSSLVSTDSINKKASKAGKSVSLIDPMVNPPLRGPVVFSTSVDLSKVAEDEFSELVEPETPVRRKPLLQRKKTMRGPLTPDTEASLSLEESLRRG